MHSSITDVAIIGAGPWGLGLAAHLRKRGIDHRIFGSPMQTWRDMPSGMNLKSLGFATNIPTPDGPTFPEYCRANGLEDYEPIEFHTFADYGMEIQRRFVPYVEDTMVTDLQHQRDEFVLTLETGEKLRAKRVVLAVGLAYFQRLPAELAGLPADRVAHSWGKKDLDSYADQDVVVVGGGSSALETAVLLHEHGARVQVLARSRAGFGGHGPREWERGLIDRIRVPISTIGHGRENWVIEHVPYLMYHLPDSKRIPFTRKHLGPISAWWLRDRLEGKFPLHTHTSIVRAEMQDGRIALHVRGEAGEWDIAADRLISATGFEVDVDRITFLSADIKRRIARFPLAPSAPRLSRRFESSLPGLFVIGPAAAMSFGPLVRFVAGSYFAVPALARHLARRPNPVAAMSRPLVGVPVVPASHEPVLTRTEL